MKKKDLELGERAHYLSPSAAKYKTKYFLLMTPLSSTLLYCPSIAPLLILRWRLLIVHVFVSAGEGFYPSSAGGVGVRDYCA